METPPTTIVHAVRLPAGSGYSFSVGLWGETVRVGDEVPLGPSPKEEQGRLRRRLRASPAARLLQSLGTLARETGAPPAPSSYGPGRLLGTGGGSACPKGPRRASESSPRVVAHPGPTGPPAQTRGPSGAVGRRLRCGECACSWPPREGRKGPRVRGGPKDAGPSRTEGGPGRWAGSGPTDIAPGAGRGSGPCPVGPGSPFDRCGEGVGPVNSG